MTLKVILIKICLQTCMLALIKTWDEIPNAVSNIKTGRNANKMISGFILAIAVKVYHVGQ